MRLKLWALDFRVSDAEDICTQVFNSTVTGQQHGATLLDADGRVLRPAILWNDGRCDAECAELEVSCDHCTI